jgi:glycosyltransferase involved in cell wall biosynthesis
MKVAIISPWAISKNAIGGTERFVADLANSLTSLGHRVTVFMLSGEQQRINDVEYVSLDVMGGGKIANEYDLREIMGDFSDESSFDNLAKKVESVVDLATFDALHINSLLFLKAWKDKHRVFTIHTNPFEYRQAWGDEAYLKTLEVLKYEASNHDVTLTAPSFHYARAFQRLTKVHVYFIPHAIDTNRLGCSEERNELFQKYGLTSSKITLLLPSRLEPVQKRPQMLFNAIAALSQDKIDCLQIVSSGLDSQYARYRDKLASFADLHGISAVFIYFETISEAYTLADAVVLPSKSESFGYSALEALSLSKVTLLNALPTFKEIGNGNPNAYFFKGTLALSELLGSLVEQRIASEKVPDTWRARYETKEWSLKYEAMLGV